MSVLKKLYAYSVNGNSPVHGVEVAPVTKIGKEGEKTIVLEPVDLKKHADMLGNVDMWSIQSLMSAGINPGAVKGHSGYTTRLDGVSDIQSIESSVDEFFDNIQNNEE